METKSFNYDKEKAGEAISRPFRIGDIDLDGRVVLAPLTRCRAKPDFSPADFAPDYYAQRSTAALVITEATQISQQGQGFPFTPGIYTQAHVEGWKKVVDAVHAKGKPIFLQLWHVGRASHSYYQPGNGLPVSSSAIALTNKQITPEGEKDSETPRPLETHEIKEIVQQYKRSAQLCKEAGFDGVEVHSAHGYLLDQFLQDNCNKRTDEYGGSIENRSRFTLEVIDAVREIYPSNRVAVRFSPTGGF